MGTEQGFVEHVQSQSGLGHDLTFKKMFGEYALYVRGKVVAFACDNQLYLKPTEAGRALLGHVVERPAYPGSKMYFLIDEQIDDRAFLQRLLLATADALPLPKPKPTPKPPSKPTPEAKTAAKAKAKAKVRGGPTRP